MTKTGKLGEKIARIIWCMQHGKNEWIDSGERKPHLEIAVQILKACKDSGLMFTRTGVVGDDLEGACICKVEEIEIG